MVSNKKFAFNYLATFWAIVANYIFLPLYLKYLGSEWFGILSIGAIIQSVLVLFDSGITTTLKREFAATLDNEYKNDLLYSFEKIIFGLFSLASLVFVLSLPFFIDYWFKIDQSMIPKATQALQLYVLIIVTQVLFFFYNGGIWGQDEQVKSSILKILFSLFRNGAVILVLLVDNSITSFILWQIAVSCIFVIIARVILKRLIPSNNEKRSIFDRINLDVVKRNFRFAGGMFLISVVSMINYQVDKIILSSTIAIELFGFYTLGFLLSQIAVSATSPIGHSIFPQLTASVENEDRSAAKRFCKEAFTMISILGSSLAIVIFFRAEEIVLYWTRNGDAALAVKATVPFLVLGSFLQSLQFIPYHLTVAYKNTKPIIIIAFMNLLITIPMYLYMISKFGMVGAGITWLVFNAFSTPVFYYFVVAKHLGVKFIYDLLIELIKILTFVSLVFLALVAVNQYLLPLNSNLFGIAFQILLIITLCSFVFLKSRMKMLVSFIQSKIQA